MNELLINGKDAYTEYGVRMGEGFLDTLTEPLTPKEPISSESRLEHGKRIIPCASPKFASREITLDFTLQSISGTTLQEQQKALWVQRRNFLSALTQGRETSPNDHTGICTIEVPALGNEEIYRLIYQGKGNSYGLDATRTFCHIMLKFEEPNPTNRGR